MWAEARPGGQEDGIGLAATWQRPREAWEDEILGVLMPVSLVAVLNTASPALEPEVRRAFEQVFP